MGGASPFHHIGFVARQLRGRRVQPNSNANDTSPQSNANDASPYAYPHSYPGHTNAYADTIKERRNLYTACHRGQRRLPGLPRPPRHVADSGYS
ncbi:MAG: hypothetical protein V3T71_00075 [Dehalococcoidia bacterium]